MADESGQPSTSLAFALGRLPGQPPTIDDLPVELLHEVFTVLAKLTMEAEKDLGIGQRLCLVNRQWNTLVLRTPGLWSHFKLKLQTNPPIAHHTPLSYLERSAQSPLKVLIMISLVQETFNASASILSVIHALKTHGSRWKHLSIGQYPSNTPQSRTLPTSLLEELLPQSLPELTQANLLNIRTPSGIPLTCLAPKLQSITNLEATHPMFVGTENLSRATFAFLPRLPSYGPSLATCSNITRLELLKDTQLNPPRRLTFRPMLQQLNHLQTLLISGFNAVKVVMIMKAIRAPQLHTIQVSETLAAREADQWTEGNIPAEAFPNLALVHFYGGCALSDIRQILCRISGYGGVAVRLPYRSQDPEPEGAAPDADQFWLEVHMAEVQHPLQLERPEHADIKRRRFGLSEPPELVEVTAAQERANEWSSLLARGLVREPSARIQNQMAP